MIQSLLMINLQQREGVTSDNEMYAIQASLKIKKFSFNSLNFHYHNYDRVIEKWEKLILIQVSLVANLESERKISDNLSFGRSN